MANNGLFQTAKVAGIVSVFITIMVIVFYAGGQSTKIKLNAEANAATVLLVGGNTGLIGDNTREIQTKHSEIMLQIMDIREEIATIEAIQAERGEP